MRHVFCTLLLCCVLTLPALHPAMAAPVLSVDNTQVFVSPDGKAPGKLQEQLQALQGENTDLEFVAVTEEAGKDLNIPGGIYIFSADGKNTGHIPFEMAEIFGGAVMSPGGTVLAVDAGMSLVREWYFFSYPDLKLLGDASEYYQYEGAVNLIWRGDKGVFLTTIDTTNEERACGYDPCGPTSTVWRDLVTGETAVVFAGTALCDYMLPSLEGDILSVKEMCLSSVKDWEKYPEFFIFETVRVNVHEIGITSKASSPATVAKNQAVSGTIKEQTVAGTIETAASDAGEAGEPSDAGAADQSAAAADVVMMLIIDKDPKGTNVRSEPSGKVLRTIPWPKNDAEREMRAVAVTGQQGAWFSVRLNDDATGWMHQSVLGTCAGATEDGDPWLLEKPENDAKPTVQIKDGTPLALLAVKGSWASVSFTDAKGKKHTGWLPEQCMYANPYNNCWK